jgi:hypothetical protein
MNSKNNSDAGKGDSPRNCFSQKYRDNYDLIDWSKHLKENDENNNDTIMCDTDSL